MRKSFTTCVETNSSTPWICTTNKLFILIKNYNQEINISCFSKILKKKDIYTVKINFYSYFKKNFSKAVR